MYKHDFICVLETYLDSSTPDSLLETDGYNLIRADHPDNIKRGGVCIYYKESLPVRFLSSPYLKEALLLEMIDNNKKITVSVIYRSPSQSNREFNSFLSSFEQLLSKISKRKPTVSIITGDFNARSSKWWSNDTNTLEGTNLYSLTSSNNFSQLINEPTHIQRNSSSCIDLIFTDRPNLAVNSGVHASLHPNCHHQVVHTNFNLNISYPSPYQRLIWDYKKEDSVKIRKALDLINWERLFKIPINQIFLTQSRLSSLDFNEDEILKMIRALNIHKAHGHDDISIRMIKICDKSLFQPLTILFQNSTKSSCYPVIWKRSNIIPAHKNNDKQLVENYRPISLLPIFGKIFEKIIFDRLYNFLLQKELLNPNQSGFRPSDSCVNQLIAITHEIFRAFDCNPSLEVRSVFLDMSKAFDKVWHEGLLYKLKSKVNFITSLKIIYQTDSKGYY